MLPIDHSVQSPERSTPGPRPGKKKIDGEKWKKACSDFEALFLARTPKVMRQTIPQNGLWGNGPGKEVYQGFMDQDPAKRGGVGLGEKLYRQVVPKEEKSDTATREGGQESVPQIEGSERR